MIPQAVDAGATVVPDCRVMKLLRKHDRVSGALCERRRPDGSTERITIRADHVFLCAGAIQTPALLQRSGFRGHAGRGLKLHPTVKIAARFASPLDHAGVPMHRITEFAPSLTIGGSVSRKGHKLVVTERQESLNLTRLPLVAGGSGPAGPEELLNSGELRDRYPSFSPDGRRIAFASNRLGDQEVWILDLPTRHRERLRLPQVDLGANFPFWSTDGRQLAVPDVDNRPGSDLGPPKRRKDLAVALPRRVLKVADRGQELIRHLVERRPWSGARNALDKSVFGEFRREGERSVADTPLDCPKLPPCVFQIRLSRRQVDRRAIALSPKREIKLNAVPLGDYAACR